MLVQEYLKENQDDFENFLIVDNLKQQIFYYGSIPLKEADKSILQNKLIGICRISNQLLEIVIDLKQNT